MEYFKHQKEGIVFLKEKKKAILADEMGLGKTLQAIVAAREVTGPARDAELRYSATLVICPASLKINWSREILKIYPNSDIIKVDAGKEQDLSGSSWVIINYDMLHKYMDQILGMIAEGKIDSAIIDEAHYIKGRKTERSVCTLAITSKLDVVYLLTGTPVMNRPRELFNLLKAIGHPLGRAVTVFAKRYCGAYMKTIIKKNGQMIRFFDDKGATHLEELREFTKGHILRRLKKDELDLPPKIIQPRIAELSKEFKKQYDTAFDSYVEYLTNNPDAGKNVENIMDARHLVELMKVKQVCSRAKISTMVEDIRNAVDGGQKVIVFSQFTGTIMELRDELMQEKKGSKYGDAKEPIKSVVLTGQNSMKERQESVDAFQNDDDTKVFIANIIAGGVGITLTAASIVMFADMEWSPELHAQAEDRAHRIGQKGTVNVYYYVAADTVEEDIIEILESKRDVIRRILDGDPLDSLAKEAERVALIEDPEEKDQALKNLTRQMREVGGAPMLSMAIDFLDRMKEKLHIHN